ncbi:MAG: ABC transporter ATP-binding protein, partial [Sneathiellales bacterium]|nr:ABC transporter ATP-binding protein [Sneathiellales bacterium]
MASIKLENVTKSYGEIEVIPPLDLDIENGEFVVLVGPSGCGKTTTLRMIAGLESVTSGEVRIGDREVTDLRPGLRNCAMVFQSYALYPHMSVRDNIGYGMKVRGESKSDVAKAIEDVAKILNLTEYLDRKPSALSGGQRQRVAIGRA